MKNLLSALMLTALLISCSGNKEAKTETQPSAEFETARSTFFTNLKVPAEVAAQLEATAAEFNPSLLSDPKMASRYTSDEVKAAANLGIYLSDLNYSVAYKQKEYTKELFTASHDLSKAIGLEEAALGYLMIRYNQNIEQNDSVKTIVNDLFDKSTASLQGTEREKLAGIAMAAYQIENIHLALGILQSYPKDMLPSDARTMILIPVFRTALMQQQNIETIYMFLKSIADPLNPDANPNYAYYSNAFGDLIATYKKLDVNDKMANNRGLELMNDAVVQELNTKVNAIRDKVIQPVN